MNQERRYNERINFETTIELMILHPISMPAFMEDASLTGLKIVTELEVDVNSELLFMNKEVENSLPFKAQVMWKNILDNGFIRYGLNITSSD